MTEPTIIEQPTTASVEALKAKLWRKNVVGLSREQLAERIAYSSASIQLFERGYDYTGRPLGERAWRRYRRACAGVHLPDFDWNDPNHEETNA